MAKPEPRVIKRYANRKLYDTVERQFTTLTELARLVEGGTRVVVSDHDTGEDRTDEVLAQALGRRMRSTPGAGDLLAGLLRTSGTVAQDLASGLAETTDAPAKSATKKSGKKSGKGKTSGAKKKPKPAVEDLTEVERQDEEIRELRSQVSELTQAVNLLLQEKLAERESD